MSQQALKNLIQQNPTATDAEIIALATTPVLTPRPDKITWTQIADVWGKDRAAQFKYGLKQLAAQTQNVPAAIGADFALGILNGQGFTPGHPEAESAIAQLIAAHLCTTTEARDVQFIVSYAVAEAVSADDVTEARRQVEAEIAAKGRQDRAAAKWNAKVNEESAFAASGYRGEPPADI